MLHDFVEMVSKEDFVVIDTETTDMYGEVVQIAILSKAGKVLLDTLVRPTELISPDATAVHGITNEMVRDAPTFLELADQIQSLIAGKNVVVYNAKFDRGRLHESATRHGLDRIEWKEISNWWCAMEASAEWYGEWNDYHRSYRWQKLATVARRLGIAVDGKAHTAIADARMTLAVVKKLAEDHSKSSA